MIRQEREAWFEVPPGDLWDLLSDTDRLNRELKLPAVDFTFLPREEGGSYLRGAARFAGVTFHYNEEPYCWSRPLHWSVRRLVDFGPLTLLRPGVDLAPERGGTRARVWMETRPRTPFARLIAQAVADSGANSLLGVCEGFARYLTGTEETPYPRHAGLPPAATERLRSRLRYLGDHGFPAELTGRLERLLIHAPIEDVAQIRPYALARRWGLERRTALEFCLSAVRGGLLDLRWRLLCPACRAPGAESAHLEDLSRGLPHCASCNIRYGPEFDRSVEVCFQVADDIRKVSVGQATYCIGGPGRSPHIVLQWYLQPGELGRTEVTLLPGVYHLTSPQAGLSTRVVVEGRGEAAILLQTNGGAVGITAPDILPAEGKWLWENRMEWPVLVRCETPGWIAEAATAAEVTSLQSFRDSFSSEVLSPGCEMAVRQIALLFSDLKGSTALYRTQGDAPSYALVRDHFAFFREVVAAHNGGIVKTMGDAVMAAFADPVDALRAALEVQRRVETLPGLPAIKIGIHAGPALVVNSSGQLDYFGQTVNRAARLQGHGIGGDIVLLESLTRDPHVAAVLANCRTERFCADLKGDEAGAQLLRVWSGPSPSLPSKLWHS